MSCSCYYCRKYAELAEARRNNDFNAAIRLAEELGCRAVSAEADADYYRCILDGSWPTAGPILEKAILRAKDIALKGANQ